MPKILAIFSCLVLVATLSSCKSRKKASDDYGDYDDVPYEEGYDDYVEVTPLDSRDESVAYTGSKSAGVTKGQFTPIYFDFDRFHIKGSERAKVDQVARHLKSNSSSRVLIAGFTDSVGTAEYNRALGERRSLAVRQALIDKGIRSNRIDTVSFGEEMPASSTHSLNRRAEFGLVK